MLCGHEKKAEFFTRLAAEGKVGHGYLFYGPPETGKRTFAETLACLLQCGKFEIASRPLIDAKIIGGSQISIDEAREIKKFFSQTPLASPKRTVIIDGSESITWQAQPAFLKIAEEPPRHTLLIFIAHDTQTLSPALLSRLEKFYFGGVSKKKVSEFLQKERGVPKDKSNKIAEQSFGRIGRAVKILEANTEPASEEPAPLHRDIEKTIVKLYLDGARKNSSQISFLLAKEQTARRFNLNPKIQAKAIKLTVPEFAVSI